MVLVKVVLMNAASLCPGACLAFRVENQGQTWSQKFGCLCLLRVSVARVTFERIFCKIRQFWSRPSWLCLDWHAVKCKLFNDFQQLRPGLAAPWLGNEDGADASAQLGETRSWMAAPLLP